MSTPASQTLFRFEQVIVDAKLAAQMAKLKAKRTARSARLPSGRPRSISPQIAENGRFAARRAHLRN